MNFSLGGKKKSESRWLSKFLRVEEQSVAYIQNFKLRIGPAQ